MLLLTENDVIGAVRVFRRILESPEWVDLTAALELQFVELTDVELPTDALDGAVWQSSQDVGALLMTGNRASGAGSLDQTIAEQAGPESLPVLTIGDPRRVMREPVYTREWGLSLLDFIERIETLRGTGRLFLPYVRQTRPCRFQSIRVGRLFQYYEIFLHCLLIFPLILLY
jgi:hypothetical protein